MGSGAGLAQTAADQPSSMPSTAKGDWPANLADLAGSRYSPQAQIDASNFNKLEVAWRFKTDMLGARPEYKLEGTPLEINGVIYTTAGSRRDAIALDAKTGELKWMYSLNEGVRAANSPRQLSGRGLSYWTDGKGDERIILVTTGYRLVELNAKNGRPIESFGDHGIIDMKLGAVVGVMGHPGEYQQIDLTTGELGWQSAAAIADDVVIVGSSMKEGYQPVTQNNTKGLVRGWDVRTGKLLWTFHDVPMKGEFGYDSWKNNSADYNGNTGEWTGLTADTELNSVYLPIEDPTLDTYGGARPGDDLFGDSLVCVDLHTGKMKWYYQLVHHPIWDYDISSPPMLVDAVVNGKPVKEVAVPTKQGFLYVFDRVTGKPVWPMLEKPVPQSDVPGEQTSKTQPFPSKPPAYSRQQLDPGKDLIDFTPDLHAKAAELIKRYKVGPIFTPPVLSKVEGPLATLEYDSSAGTNWTGGAFDPETHTVYVPAAPSAVSTHALVAPPPGILRREVSGRHRRSALCRAGRRRRRVRLGRAQANAGRSQTGGDPGQERGDQAGRSAADQDRRRPAARQAALRHHHRHQHGYRRFPLADRARRHTGRDQEQSGAQGSDHPQDRSGRQRGHPCDQDPRYQRRSPVLNPTRPPARLLSARL